jgi:ABC-type transport system involved in cytochrome c biogenesis ATPase subunit
MRGGRMAWRRALWAYDELAQAKDRTLLDNLQTAMGKRKHSLGMIISTQAADDEHPLSRSSTTG